MKIVFLRQPYKFILRSDKKLKEKIKYELLKILENPSLGKKLKGSKLKGILSYCFMFLKVNYRIAYRVVDNLLIISIASRENFYKDLQI